MLDDDAEASETASLELDLTLGPVTPLPGEVPSHPIARVPQRLPEQAAPPVPLAVVPPPLPVWLEPLANVPVALSKRVVGYSLFAFVLNVVFFRGGLVLSFVVLTLAAVGGVAMWAASRLER